MENCIFCRIVRGELPCYKTYEDGDFIGFLDITPLNLGNSLLITKKHYRWVYDVPNFGAYWEAAKKLALATQKITKSYSVNFLTLGEEVPHAHIRIIPRFSDDGHGEGINMKAIKQIEKQKMQQIADKIYQAVKNE